MSQAFRLCDRAAKEYIALGRSRGDRFQMPAERIAAFLADRAAAAPLILELHGERNTPHEGGGWRCVDSWDNDEASTAPVQVDEVRRLLVDAYDVMPAERWRAFEDWCRGTNRPMNVLSFAKFLVGYPASAKRSE